MIKSTVVERKVSVITKDGKTTYKNKLIYLREFGRGITGLYIRIAGWWYAVDYIGNRKYQLTKNIDWSK